MFEYCRKLHRLCAKQKKTERAFSFANAFYFIYGFRRRSRPPRLQRIRLVEHMHTHTPHTYNVWQRWRRRQRRTNTIWIRRRWMRGIMHESAAAGTKIQIVKTAAQHKKYWYWLPSSERTLRLRLLMHEHRATFKYACHSKMKLSQTNETRNNGQKLHLQLMRWWQACLPFATT